MLLDLIIFSISLALLIYSSDKFVDVSVSIAKKLNLSAMTIGLTIVAIGTSLPELMASSIAAFRGVPGIAVGNVLGSNICNIALIAAVAGFYANIQCQKRIVKTQGLIMILATISFGVVAYFYSGINKYVGAIFLLSYVWFSFDSVKSLGTYYGENEEDNEVDADNFMRLFVILMVSLSILLLSSDYLVESAVDLARTLSIPEDVIALSLIAFGTSVPELSVSISSAKKKEFDVLVGNILGSNICNILLVCGVSSFFAFLPIQGSFLKFDFTIALITSVLFCVFLLQKNGINRQKSIFLLSIYFLGIIRLFFIKL